MRRAVIQGASCLERASLRASWSQPPRVSWADQKRWGGRHGMAKKAPRDKRRFQTRLQQTKRASGNPDPDNPWNVEARMLSRDSVLTRREMEEVVAKLRRLEIRNLSASEVSLVLSPDCVCCTFGPAPVPRRAGGSDASQAFPRDDGPFEEPSVELQSPAPSPPKDPAALSSDVNEENEAPCWLFVFANGAVVIWGMEAKLRRDVFEEVRDLMGLVRGKVALAEGRNVSHQLEGEGEVLPFGFGDSYEVADDTVWLLSPDGGVRDMRDAMYLCSEVLAKSVELDTFEKWCRVIQVEVRDLIQRPPGWIWQTRKTQRERERRIRLMHLHLHSLKHDYLLDDPEMIWDEEYWEPFYRNLHSHFHITPRADLVEERLEDFVASLKSVYDNQNHRSSMTLEIAIVILIFIEILIALPQHLGLH